MLEEAFDEGAKRRPVSLQERDGAGLGVPDQPAHLVVDPGLGVVGVRAARQLSTAAAEEDGSGHR